MILRWLFISSLHKNKNKLNECYYLTALDKFSKFAVLFIIILNYARNERRKGQHKYIR